MEVNGEIFLWFDVVGLHVTNGRQPKGSEGNNRKTSR